MWLIRHAHVSRTLHCWTLLKCVMAKESACGDIVDSTQRCFLLLFFGGHTPRASPRPCSPSSPPSLLSHLDLSSIRSRCCVFCALRSPTPARCAASGRTRPGGVLCAVCCSLRYCCVLIHRQATGTAPALRVAATLHTMPVAEQTRERVCVRTESWPCRRGSHCRRTSRHSLLPVSETALDLES